MKERAKRFLTSIVAALTLVGSVPTQAFASELEPDSSLISPQDTDNTPDVGSANAPAGENSTAVSGDTTVKYPTNAVYTVSGTNDGGLVVTVDHTAAANSAETTVGTAADTSAN